MKSHILKVVVACMVSGSFLGCKEEEVNPDTAILGLGGDTWVKGPLDNWLEENFVVPYNIEVKYRFDRYEVALNRVLVPTREDRVIPVMETIKKTWIDPYEQEAGSHFIKRLSPKQFVLVGSPEYNPNGTITLGYAEGGRKVVLFKLNDFATNNNTEVKRMLQTIHHEFAHILHQTIMYPEEYKRITTDYSASWNDYSLEDARSRGYITQYARNKPDDDFAEMIAIMLTQSRSDFNATINSAPAPAQALLRQKEQLVVKYFKDTWNIDIYSLQTRSIAAINAL